MSIAILTRFKNERHIMFEWIHHHLEEKIDKIFMIDDNSDDDYYELNKYWLDNLINENKIEILKSINTNQKEDYDNFLDYIKNKYTWLIQIDIDEFIFTPNENKSLKDILNIEYKNMDYIKIKWKLFSHRNKFQPKSVIDDNIITHFENTDPTSLVGIKCICKTEFLKSVRIHEFIFSKNINAINLFNSHNNNIQINHYRTQSDEFLYGVKEIRGGGVHKNKYKNMKVNSLHLKFNKVDLLLKNKKKNLIEILNKNNQVKPNIYSESSFYIKNKII